jgi:hypothetical protein
LLVLAAMPQRASARSRHLPGIFGAITAPIGALFGAGRRIGRGHRTAHHTPYRGWAAASRSAPAAAAAAVPAAGVAAATSTGFAHEPNTPEPATKTNTSADQPAKPADASSAEPASSDAAVAHAEMPTATTASVPAAAPEPPPLQAQRNAALSLPKNELRPGLSEPSRKPKPSPDSFPLGMIGPLTWPTAYQDVIGYALWPAEYGQRLRSHGIADVLGAVFVSPATLAAKAGATHAQAKASGGASAAGAPCSAAIAASPDWPAAEIERSIELTPAQRSALGQLKSSLSQAVASISSACRDTAEMSPTERLQAMQAMLWAVHDAALLVRAPLAAFYESLSDDQKKQFSAPTSDDAASHTMSRGEMARICGMPASLESSMRQIERSLQTNKVQRASLETLNKRSFEMGQFLMASCLKPIPATPSERLDSAADRLTAVLFAASSLGPAINDFYAQLNDEQKTKLKSLR